MGRNGSPLPATMANGGQRGGAQEGLRSGRWVAREGATGRGALARGRSPAVLWWRRDEPHAVLVYNRLAQLEHDRRARDKPKTEDRPGETPHFAIPG